MVYDDDHITREFEVLHLRVIHSKRRTGFEETKDFPIREGELLAGRYQVTTLQSLCTGLHRVQATCACSSQASCAAPARHLPVQGITGPGCCAHTSPLSGAAYPGYRLPAASSSPEAMLLWWGRSWSSWARQPSAGLCKRWT